MTVSVGAAWSDIEVDDWQTLIHREDTALYEANAVRMQLNRKATVTRLDQRRAERLRDAAV